MSLPDVPNTLREKYYSVMAGQNDADILPDIETAPSTENRYLDYIARNGGGGGGDVTKEYVDEQDAKKADKVTSATAGNFAGLDSNGNLTDSGKKAADFATADDMTDVQSVIPSTATTSNKLATASDVTGEDISATSTTSPLTDSADGMVQGLTIYGQSEVVEGEIVSAGEGYAVVDLGTLDWEYISDSAHSRFEVNYLGIKRSASLEDKANILCAKYDTRSSNDIYNHIYNKSIAYHSTLYKIWVYDTTYTDAATFKSAMSGVMLVYELADHTQGNAIAVKTDDGTGINGTMAVFSTGTPLRGIPDTDVRDVMQWDGSAREVTKNCGEVDLGTLEWNYSDTRIAFNTPLSDIANGEPGKIKIICSKYQTTGTVSFASDVSNIPNMSICQQKDNQQIFIKDTDYADAATFKTAMSGVHLIYELATPITTPLTDAEISAFRGLCTYDSTTNITISDEPEFELDYLKNTGNGQAVANIQRDLQEQIDDLGAGSTSPVKMFSWTGTGATSNTVVFPDKPKAIVGIWGEGTSDDDSIVWIGQCFGKGQRYPYNWVSGSQPGTSYSNVSWNTEANSMTLSHTEAAGCANKNGAIYYCLYI